MSLDQNFWNGKKFLAIRNIHVLYNKSHIPFGSKVMANVSFFSKVCNQLRVGGQNIWYQQKHLATSTTHD